MYLNKSLPQNILPFEKSWDSFYKFDLDKAAQQFSTDNPVSFEKEGQQMALLLFHEMAERVPAYQKFLTEYKIAANKIKTAEDLENVPWIDKENYLKNHQLT